MAVISPHLATANKVNLKASFAPIVQIQLLLEDSNRLTFFILHFRGTLSDFLIRYWLIIITKLHSRLLLHHVEESKLRFIHRFFFNDFKAAFVSSSFHTIL